MRKDVEGAFRAYEGEWEATGGSVSFETCEMLYMLQDDTGRSLADRIEA